VSAPTINCDSSRYYSGLSWIIILLIFPVTGFPLLLIGILCKNRHHLYAPTKKLENGKELEHYRAAIEGRKFGSIYETYRKERYWWEPVALLRRTVLIAVSISTTQPIYLGEGFLFVCLWMILMQVSAKPYFIKIDNKLERISLFCLAAITVLQTTVLTSSNTSVVTEVILTLFIVLPIAFMVTYIANLSWRSFKHNQAQKGRDVQSPSIDGMPGSDIPRSSDLPDPMKVELDNLNANNGHIDGPPGLEGQEDGLVNEQGELQLVEEEKEGN